MSISKVLVKNILEAPHKFEWSLQGMGMLRLYLPDEHRLHIWDSRYRVPNVSMLHDHAQWGLTSHIVAGAIRNHIFVEDEKGDEYEYATLKPGYGCYFKSGVSRIRLSLCSVGAYRPGDSYSQMSHEIHQTQHDEGTVTIMRKHPTWNESARVFWPAGTQWVSAEPRAATAAEVHDITSNALQRWF